MDFALTESSGRPFLLTYLFIKGLEAYSFIINRFNTGHFRKGSGKFLRGGGQAITQSSLPWTTCGTLLGLLCFWTQVKVLPKLIATARLNPAMKDTLTQSAAAVHSLSTWPLACHHRLSTCHDMAIYHANLSWAPLVPLPWTAFVFCFTSALSFSCFSFLFTAASLGPIPLAMSVFGAKFILRCLGELHLFVYTVDMPSLGLLPRTSIAALKI